MRSYTAPWLVSADVAVGWRVVYGEADRAACLNYIEQNWPEYTAEESARDAGSGSRANSLN